MALLATQTVQQAGIVPVRFQASAGGDSFQPSTTTVLLIANSDSVSHTATVAVTATDFGQTVPSVVITVPAAGEVLAGPYDPGEVAQPGTGMADITYSDATVMTIAVIEA